MAKLTAGASDKLAFKSLEGTSSNLDSVAIRLADDTVTTKVYIERSTKKDSHQTGTHADPATSFFISGSDVYSATCVAGVEIHVITDGDDVELRIDADDSGEVGSD